MPRLRFLIEYDGSRYSGWQVQIKDRTVQGEIQNALHLICRESCQVIGAGRTDTGVHARGQVAHADLENLPDLGRLKRSLNGILDKDIRIKDIQVTSNDFHARFSAKTRIYRYQIANTPQALMRNQCWEYLGELDVPLMNDAANCVLGTHDFKGFCRAIAKVNNYLCTVHSAGWQNKGNLIEFRVEANRFLHGMVRALVGTMVDIGRNKRPLQDMNQILKGRDRRKASQAAPAKGLILDEITY